MATCDASDPPAYTTPPAHLPESLVDRSPKRMSIMNTRLVTGPLTAFVADPDRIHTALDRQSILECCAEIVAGLASAIATVDDKVNPPSSIAGRRNRAERRWAVASRDLDDASRAAGTLSDRLREAARTAGELITEGEPVRYVGSLTEYHGRYVLLSDCSCDPDCPGFEIHRGPRGTALTCVNATSLYPSRATAWAGCRPASSTARAGCSTPNPASCPRSSTPSRPSRSCAA
ncbi:hypothetical protein Asp14428_45360 [Actinoplanes sp. NBRC 14428]|nr:hypothetical protein Asp14428_45360 [Actinoplanes sp. NBRC 14428]